LGLINLAYEHRAALAKNAIEYTGAELAQVNKLTDALYAQQQRAAALTEAQRAMNEQYEKSIAFWEKEKTALEKTTPQFTINAQWYQRLTDELKELNAAHDGEIVKLGQENAARSKTSVNQIADQIKQAKKYSDDMAKIWRDGIAKITTDGFKSFLDFAEDLNRLFTRLMDKMAEQEQQPRRRSRTPQEHQSQNNSQLRIFNATGQSDAAFDLQQSLEIQQAIADGLDEISIALLKDAQNAERAQREREKQTEILQNQLSTAQQTADALQQIYDSLDQFSKSLDVGQYSPLSPRQQLDSSRGSLNALYQAALGGDQAAAGQFSGAAQSFLDASRKYNASGAGYVLDFNSVKVMTDALKKQFGSSLTDAQKQVSLLQQQLDELKRIAGGMDTLVSRPNLTPQVPDPIPVGGSGRPRIEAGTGASQTTRCSCSRRA
jgi:hypothetical protein